MLSKFSVKRPFTVFVAVIMIIILGIISFTHTTTDLLPSMDLPYVIIATSYVGASPEKVEQTVTKPLEESLATTSNIENISSTSNENSSMVILEFQEGSNMDSILIELNSKIDMVKSAWTDETIGTPMVMKLNPNMMPIMVSAISISDMSREEITKYFNDNILPELEKVEGVASVSTTGLLEESISIQLSQEKIDALNQKVLNSIDSNLAKAQGQLNSAKSKLQAGKKELENQSKTQNEKIAEGVAAIKLGREEILKTQTNLDEKESSLNLLNTTLDSTIKRLEKEKANLEENKKKLQEENKDENLLKIEAINQAINVVNLGIENTKKSYEEFYAGEQQLQEGKKQLEEQKTLLANQEKDLELAKVNLNTQLNNAYSEIVSGETKLNDSISEFEKSRDEAYEKADLNGIITQSMISNILTAENFSMPAGYIPTNEGDIIVKVGDKFNNIDELKDLLLFSYDIEDVGDIKLSDVAEINYINNADELFAKVNNEDGVMISVQKQSTASTKTVSDKIQEAMNKIEEKYDNVEFTNLMDQGMYIDVVVGSVLQNLIYGGILAVIILFIFLRDVKPTIIIALSIPVSLTFAIALMYFTGVTINIISLSGLALGVGMLVDNSIVVIENIYRLRNEGKSKLEAAIDGAGKVAGAICSSTLTTVCVFLPIVFIEGMTRDLFQDMGLTIAYSLIASLIMALTLVPAMASKMFNKQEEKSHKIFDKFSSAYEKILNKALNHKAITLISAVVLLVVSVGLAFNMGMEFIPSMEGNQMSLTVTMPEGSSYEDLKQTSIDITSKLLEIEDIEKVGAMKSSSSSLLSSSSEQSTSMYIILKDNKKMANADIEKVIIEKTQNMNCDIDISTSNMDLSALGGAGVEVIVKGNDLDILQSTAKDIANIMENTEGFDEIDNGIGETSKQKSVIINKNKAMEYGLTVAQVYQTIAGKLTTEKEATTVTIDNKDYPVVVISSKENNVTEDTLSNIKLEVTQQNSDTSEINLNEIANIENTNSLNSISRDNGQRYVSVTGTIDSEHNIALVSRDFEEKLKDYETPDGVNIEISGENETINDSLKDLALMILLAVVFIYLIMVAQFQSLKAPFIVMFTIPLAFTGGFLALFITGTNISIIAMLGLLILAGIVVNNGIVLIDYIGQLRQTGMNKKEAILLAGKTRLRPILMTALTTILGLSTMALGIGMGADMIQPLGIVTIGGLIYSTLLTLLVVPCIYDIAFRKE